MNTKRKKQAQKHCSYYRKQLKNNVFLFFCLSPETHYYAIIDGQRYALVQKLQEVLLIKINKHFI